MDMLKKIITLLLLATIGLFAGWMFSDNPPQKIAELRILLTGSTVNGDNLEQWIKKLPVLASTDGVIQKGDQFLQIRAQVLETGKLLQDTIYIDANGDTVKVDPLVLDGAKIIGTSTVQWNKVEIKQDLISQGRNSADVDTFLLYIEDHIDLALQQQEKYGIPACIKLAQGLLESNAGRSWLARNANAHFGRKCLGNVSKLAIDCVRRHDDHWSDRFEVYSSVADSYSAHSQLIVNSWRYKNLLKYNDPTRLYKVPKSFRSFLDKEYGTYYELWAAGLKAGGYATSDKYTDSLIRIILSYRLYEIT